MTKYLAIKPQQEVFDLGATNGLVQYGFNVLSENRPTPTFLQDLIKILVDAGVGQENVNIFGSSLAEIPDEHSHDGAILHIKATSGTAPKGTHNDGPGAYRQPGAQIIVRALNVPDAVAMANAAMDAFLVVRNQDVA